MDDVLLAALDRLLDHRQVDPGEILLDQRMRRRLADEEKVPADIEHRLAERLAGEQVVAEIDRINWLRVLVGVDGGALNVRYAIREWCTARRRMGYFVPCWTLLGVERTSRNAARLRQD